MITHTYEEEMRLVKEEKKMKCPKCHKEWTPHPESQTHCLYCSARLDEESKRPNPSPRDIFQHIKTECEHRSFNEFMNQGYGAYWKEPISGAEMANLKSDHPDWYSWLQSKGLVQKEKVKKKITGNASWT